MDMAEIKKHWEELARTYGDEIFATTKNKNIKALEINSLKEQILKITDKCGKKLNILEIGCGNGLNCIELGKHFPQHTFYGVDYVEDMIAGALKNKSKGAIPNVEFHVGDVLKLSELTFLKPQYDVIFTVRCLINLNTFELQREAIRKIEEKITHRGYYLMLENSADSHSQQNTLRVNTGLPLREAAPYNLFFKDSFVLDFCKQHTALEFVEINNFASLHDIMLYVILPLADAGKVSYDSPVMDAVTDFLLKNSCETSNKFGEFGQNKLFIFKKL